MCTLNVGVTQSRKVGGRGGGVKMTRVSQILRNSMSETHAHQQKQSAIHMIKSIYSKIIGMFTRISTHRLGKRVRVEVHNTTFSTIAMQ